MDKLQVSAGLREALKTQVDKGLETSANSQLKFLGLELKAWSFMLPALRSSQLF